MCDVLHNYFLSYNVHTRFFASFEAEQQLLDRATVGVMVAAQGRRQAAGI